jgi:GxxExxY protein
MEKDPRTHKIIGAAMEVHNEMGPGHLEAVYQECLEIEFELQNISFISKPKLSLYYKKRKLKKFYVPDFIVFKEIVVEIKAQKMLTKDDEAQLINFKLHRRFHR